ncbi:MAG: T9SS C-terminal target domain-containing protein, partial [Flavobacteriales bacterium]|nr:T9SS C-terminal target domain-containing protein [Flavobacteriales bacterium]
PDAPDVSVQEYDREILLYLSNENGLFNNYHESYHLLDPSIPEWKNDTTLFTEYERSYAFEGYLVYQLKDETVSPDQLNDITKARLVAQCDVENEVDDIVNFYIDPTINEIVPSLMVQGENKGIRHSFQVKNDLFAQGDNRLVNHKTY